MLHSWDEVIPNLVVAYCIGLTILALVASVRCTVMQRFRGRVHMRYVIYFAVIVAGAIGGASLSRLFLRGGYSGATNMHEGYVWIVAVIFSLVAGSIALFINFSWVKLAQSRRDVERAERAAIEEQLRALQAQIEPHFLFNTLANLDALIAVDATQARALLANLIRYLRAALTHARSEEWLAGEVAADRSRKRGADVEQVDLAFPVRGAGADQVLDRADRRGRAVEGQEDAEHGRVLGVREISQRRRAPPAARGRRPRRARRTSGRQPPRQWLRRSAPRSGATRRWRRSSPSPPGP